MTSEGRVFVIRPQFVSDPPGAPKGAKYYPGYVEAVVQQFDVPVERAQKRMQSVQVYPYVSIRPVPSDAPAVAAGHDLLRAGEEGCVKFEFQGNRAGLGDGSYTMGVRLVTPLKFEGAFRAAKLRMNGRDLDDVPQGGGLWQARVPFQPSGNTFCIVVGRPGQAGAETVQVHFGLLQDSDPYYEQLNVVDPDLSVRIGIATPDSLQSWGSWLTLLLTLLLLYSLYLFWKSRQPLAPDLGISLGGGALALAPAQLAEGSFGSRWLGLPQGRPVISLSGDKEIGRVRPLDDELFTFQPASGFGSLSVEEAGEWRPVKPGAGGAWLVTAGRTYRAGAGDDARFFRLDYSAKRPRI